MANFFNAIYGQNATDTQALFQISTGAPLGTLLPLDNLLHSVVVDGITHTVGSDFFNKPELHEARGYKRFVTQIPKFYQNVEYIPQVILTENGFEVVKESMDDLPIETAENNLRRLIYWYSRVSIDGGFSMSLSDDAADQSPIVVRTNPAELAHMHLLFMESSIDAAVTQPFWRVDRSATTLNQSQIAEVRTATYEYIRDMTQVERNYQAAIDNSKAANAEDGHYFYLKTFDFNGAWPTGALLRHEIELPNHLKRYREEPHFTRKIYSAAGNQETEERGAE